MHCPHRKSEGQKQLEQLGKTKYFLNITFPLEQFLWLALYVPQMKPDVIHATRMLAWESLL